MRCGLVAACVLGAFGSRPEATRAQPLEAAAREIVTAARFAALITVDASGAPQARTVDPLVADSGWTVFIATNPRTRKVAEIERDPRVTLYWFDPTIGGYVTLRGKASALGPKAAAGIWKPEWAPFYPNRATDLVVYRIDPVRLEVVSPARGVLGDSLTWQPPEIEFRPRR
mgnify:FL=1